MREVKAIIRPQRLDLIMAALREIPGLPGVTVSNVHAYAGSGADDRIGASESAETDLTKLEIVVPVEIVERVVTAIGRAAHTGRAGDGVVFVIPVDQFVRVRDVEGGNSLSASAGE